MGRRLARDGTRTKRGAKGISSHQVSGISYQAATALRVAL